MAETQVANETRSTQSPEGAGAGRSWTLGQALASLREEGSALPASIGEEAAGWHRLDELFVDETRIANWLEYRSRSHEDMDEKATAAFVMADYAYLYAAVSAPLFVGFGLVLDMAPGTVHLRFGGGEPAGTQGYAIRGAAFRFSANGAVAAPPPTLDQAELCSRCRERTQAHVSPLIRRLSQGSKLSQSSFWRILADAIASAFLQTGERMERCDFATSSALAILKKSGSPLHNRQTGFVDLSVVPEKDAPPLSRRFRVRGGCCRYYTVKGGSLCVTCVLRDPAERDRDLLEQIVPPERP